ncbi:MAG: lipid IV(A) 3-deoxy-D-manno-octulosonic acid transferase, partial [bacterium]|nr:lipid IV(A) 3-deoxy-D-manno-octulosonic acid transferase [bacterium]
MRFIYSFFMYLLTPYLLVRLWWKGRRLPAYKKRIAERFTLDKNKYKRVDIWIHAVSLGEVIAATPLIDALLDNHWSVLVTTMTPTGSERVLARFGTKVAHCYVPYDIPIVIKRFFKQMQPRVGVIMETELWPNLIHYANQFKVPLMLANGRLSEKSLKGYMKLKFLFKPILNQFSAILTQSKDDAERFIAMGAEKKRVHALGNIKFDLQTNAIDKSKFQQLKSAWGKDRVVIIAASTHEDEEEQLLTQLRRAQLAIHNVILLIAPRHPERFQPVYQLSCQHGFNTGLRSSIESLSADSEVVVLDSLGELLGLYQISDYAFVGGSLVPIGGHNVLEPIAMGVPVLSGPYVHNFKTICGDLQQAQAIEIVTSSAELIDVIIKLHNMKEMKEHMVMNARAVLENNQGAVLKHVAKIEQEL